MFNGFNRQATEFLAGIRANNNKPWFEAHKEIYQSEVYRPLCELAQELFEPYSGISDMMFKAGRIYKDPFLSPEIRYRDTMWIYVRHEAYWWNKTPALFFEISPDGAAAGFRIQKPDARVLEQLRNNISDENDELLKLYREIKNDKRFTVVTEQYKRRKEGAQPFNEELFNIRGISIYSVITDGRTLYSKGLKKKVAEIFEAVFPIEEYFNELVKNDFINKAEKEISDTNPFEQQMTKAPDVDFMW